MNWYNSQFISNGLPEEYQDALRAGMELKKQESAIDEKSETDGEEAGENTRRVRKRKSLRVYVALAAVMIMVLAVSISSVGDGRSLMKTIKSMVGEREVVKVNSGEDNYVIEVESEEEAYQTIRDELGIIPVQITDIPIKARFQKAVIEDELKVAEVYYQYQGDNITYIINGDQAKNSIGMNIEDEILENYTLEVEGLLINVQGREISSTKQTRYYASFSYKDIKYFLVASIKQEEFEQILKNLYFP